MISNEEMYEFASLIAGISDSDLQQYKCGGKTKMKKGCGGLKTKKIQNGAPINNLDNKNFPKPKTSKPTTKPTLPPK